MTDVKFESLNIVINGKGRSWRGFAQARGAREETINIGHSVTSSNFNSKMGRPSCVSNKALTFLNLRKVIFIFKN